MGESKEEGEEVGGEGRGKGGKIKYFLSTFKSLTVELIRTQ